MKEEPSLFSQIPEAKPQVLTVAELTFQIKNRLEREFHDVWVGGEVGKCTDHGSGMYFSLKDEQALVEAVIWRRDVKRVLKFALETGAQVVVHGYLDLYAPRGQYKLIVDQIEPKGIGSLQKRFEQLKKKLAEEGLFEESRKRPIPFLPRRIGIVTAREGAAIQDILSTILHRFPKASIVFRPSRVQGESAAADIARAIADLNEVAEIDVLIVGRGGGSLEDLWAFNEEVVARAIVASKIPVISAVGHEVDFTISDFVADRRAKTPTDAGVIAVPDLQELEFQLAEHGHRLRQKIESRLRESRDSVKALREHWVLRKPVDMLQNLKAQLESELESLANNFEKQIRERRERCARLGDRLTHLRPDARLARQQGRLRELFGQLDAIASRKIAKSRESYAVLAEKLEGRSPVAILGRGYSLTRLVNEKHFLTKAEKLSPGQEIETILHRGKIISKIERVDPGESKN